MSYLDKGDFAGTQVALGVSDDHLTIVFQPALLTQHIVDAGHSLVPLIVVTITRQYERTVRLPSKHWCIFSNTCS